MARDTGFVYVCRTCIEARSTLTLLSLSLSLSLSLPCARFLDGRVNAHFIQAVSLRGMMSKATKPRPSIAIAGAHGVSNARRTR